MFADTVVTRSREQTLLRSVDTRVWFFFVTQPGVCTLCDGSVYALQVEFDLCPARRCQHLLPHQRDLLEARRDLLVVQLQPPVLQVALRGCEASKHGRNESAEDRVADGKKGGMEGGSEGASDQGDLLSAILRDCLCERL